MLRLVLFRLVHERQVAFALRLYRYGHTYIGVGLLQVYDVRIKEPDTTFAGASRHRAFVVRASVDADTAMPRSLKAQEPVAVGKDVSTSVVEVVAPCAGILNLLYFETLLLDLN